MYKKILSINKENNRKLIWGLVLQVLLAIVTVLSAEVLRGAIDSIQYNNKDILYKMVVLGVGVTLMNVFLQYAANMTLVKVENTTEKTIQLTLLSKVISLQKPFSGQYSSGDIVTKLSQNIPEAVKGVINSTKLLVEGTTIILASIIYMAMLSIPLTIAMLVYNAFVRILTPWFNKNISRLNKKIVAQNNHSNGFVIQLISNALMVRTFKREAYFLNKFQEQEKQICRDNLKAFTWSNGATEVIWATKKIAEVLILFGLGGILIYSNKMDFGVIAAFTVASDILGKGLNALIEGITMKARVIPEIEAIFEILDNPHEEEGVDIDRHLTNGEIIFEHVTFAHEDKVILENVSFTVPAGRKVLIIGGNGQGKSTILKLVSGLYRPQKGRIFIDGKDTSELHINAISNQCTYISQTPHLFEGTAYENISFPKRTDLEVCGQLMENFLMSNLDIQDIRSYSKGEKQRIGIARGMHKINDNNILLGDEIFANVDVMNKKNIARILEEKCKEKTVMMVCHEDVGFSFNKILIVEAGQAKLEDIKEGKVI